ncbi:MAG: GntR family transcriptional regulator [Armatimonadetes bacterium]|nr:GntR family transcriptional regulator [Candidatus Hippobium faecium]
MKKYLELKNSLKTLIESSKPHDMLPSHSRLMEKYGVSDITIRKALAELDKEGLIYTHHGKGRFVSPKIKFFPEIYCVFDNLNMRDAMAQDYIFPTLADNLNAFLMEKDFEMLLALYRDREDYERQIIQRLQEKNPHGAIYLYSGIKSNIPFYQQALDILPNTVFIDRYCPEITASAVTSDNYGTIIKMVEEIKDEKFDAVFVISDCHRSLTSDETRVKAYMDALSETASRDCIVDLINHKRVTGYQEIYFRKVTERLGKTKKVCFCCANSSQFRNFFMAHRKELKEQDYVKAFFFDKPMKTKPKNISITYAEQNLEMIAKEAVRIIWENKGETETVRVPPKIIHF